MHKSASTEHPVGNRPCARPYSLQTHPQMIVFNELAVIYYILCVFKYAADNGVIQRQTSATAVYLYLRLGSPTLG